MPNLDSHQVIGIKDLEEDEIYTSKLLKVGDEIAGKFGNYRPCVIEFDGRPTGINLNTKHLEMLAHKEINVGDTFRMARHMNEYNYLELYLEKGDKLNP